jgi:3-hydroxyisobutyrate dehydrogenase-like beta-hydroxyacid dehydrogenase
MRVAVVGPGAIGETIAAHLIRSGLNQLLCARTAVARLVVECRAMERADGVGREERCHRASRRAA